MEMQSLVDRALRRKKIPAGKKAPPVLSGGLPVLGHSVDFLKAPIALLERAHKELGELAAFQVFNRRMVVMFGPEAHEAIFRAPDEVLSPMEAYKIMTPVFGKDIVYDATPAKMAEQLKMLLPALKDKRMRTYGEAVVYETEKTIAEWGDSGTVDIVDFCRVLTNFTSSRCLLGKEFREGMSDEFAHVYHDLERGVIPLAYVNAHLPIPAFRKRDKARVRMVEMITEIVEARRRNKREGEDFLQTLMDSRYADGKALTHDEITGMLLAGMFAGHHTSSVTTAWTLIELLLNPVEMKRAVEEVDRVFAGGKSVTHALIRELTYTENVVKEALRMHPPLFMLVRVVKKDFIYKDYFLKEGTWIIVSPTVAHRMPEVFKNPDAFDPDRYAEPRSEDKRDFAYIAFGGGRHKCLGNAFAILQIKAIMALLLGQYEFALSGDEIGSDFQGLVVGPKEPCRLRYKKRAEPSVTLAMAGDLMRAAAEAHPAAQPGADAAAIAAQAKAAGCPYHEAIANGTAPPMPTDAKHAPANAHANAKSNSSAKLRIFLDRDLCQGHAVCVGEVPEVFKIADDGKVALVSSDIDPKHYAGVRDAAKFCPTRTIRVEED